LTDGRLSHCNRVGVYSKRKGMEEK